MKPPSGMASNGRGRFLVVEEGKLMRVGNLASALLFGSVHSIILRVGNWLGRLDSNQQPID